MFSIAKGAAVIGIGLLILTLGVLRPQLRVHDRAGGVSGPARPEPDHGLAPAPEDTRTGPDGAVLESRYRIEVGGPAERRIAGRMGRSSTSREGDPH